MNTSEQAVFDQLTAEVTAETTVEKSAVALLGNISTQLQNALNAGSPADQTAAIQAVLTTLQNNDTELAAAVTANTPAAAPPATPAP